MFKPSQPPVMAGLSQPPVMPPRPGQFGMQGQSPMQGQPPMQGRMRPFGMGQQPQGNLAQFLMQHGVRY